MFQSYLEDLTKVSNYDVHPRTNILWTSVLNAESQKWDMDYFIWPDNTVIPVDDFIEQEWCHKSDDYYRITMPGYVEQESKTFWAYVHSSWNQDRKRPNKIVENKEINSPGFTKESYIERWVKAWFKNRSKGPSFKEVVTGLNGVINGWHNVIGSTAPAYLTAPGFACTLYQAATKHEGNSQVWQAVQLF